MSLDRAAAEQFLSVLCGEQIPTVTFQTFDDCEPKDSRLARVLHGTLEQHWQALADLQSRGAGVFVTVNGTDGKGRRKPNLVVVRAWWADLDGIETLPALPLEPSLVVRTRHGWHVYWLAEPGVSPADCERINGLIVARLGGDKHAKDCSRVLRVPGFTHLKDPSNPFMITLEQSGDARYSISAMEEAFVPRRRLLDSARRATPSTSVLERASAYLDKCDPAVSGSGGHTTTFRVAVALVQGFRLSAEDALSLLLHNYNPRCQPPWSEAELMHKVSDAASAKSDRAAGWLLNAAPEPRSTMTAAGSSEAWRESLDWVITETGKRLKKTPGNLALMLTHLDGWAGTLGFDELRYRAVWLREPPIVHGLVSPGGAIADQHYPVIQQWFSQRGHPVFPTEMVAQAVLLAADYRWFSPVRQYLSGLRWDHQERIHTWLKTYFSDAVAPSVPVGLWWLVSAVARAERPGCQADHMLVLEGPQGVGKSTAAGILGGEWFSNELGDLRDKDAAQSLSGVWIMEVPELDALRRADLTRVKTFISTRADHYRPSYGRNFIDRPRSCIFIGTTNESKYLHDPSGGRRFWPVAVGELRTEELARDRDQIWAEAAHLWLMGQRWWPRGKEECAPLAEAVEQRYSAHPWESVIAATLHDSTEEWTVERLLRGPLGVEVQHQTHAMATTIGDILARLGYRPQRKRVNGKIVKVYSTNSRAWNN